MSEKFFFIEPGASALPSEFNQFQFMAFVDGPLIEKVGEFVGRVVTTQAGKPGGIAKVLPLPWLQKLFKKTERGTEEQEKEDGKRVICLFDAIQIVESWLNALQEGVDSIERLTGLAEGMAGKKFPSLTERIAQDLRNHALKQTKKKNNFFPDPKKKGKNKGKVVDRQRRIVGDHKRRRDYQPDSEYPGKINLPGPIPH